MEGAVRSGYGAAEVLSGDKFLVADLPAKGLMKLFGRSWSRHPLQITPAKRGRLMLILTSAQNTTATLRRDEAAANKLRLNYPNKLT